MFLFSFVLFSSCLNVYTKISYNTLTPPVSKTDASADNIDEVAKMCLLNPQRGPCRAGLQMHYFNAKDMNCASTFTWGGCQGNGNRFDTEEECEEQCFRARYKRRPEHCLLNFDYGRCFGEIKRWYYDRVYGDCKETMYSGCGGNANRFGSKAECDQACVKDNRKAPYKPTE